MPRRSKPLTDPPEQLSVDDQRNLLIWLQKEVNSKRLPPHFMGKALRRSTLDDCLDWHRMNGRQRCDWPATVRSWFRKAAQFERERGVERAARYHFEHPQEPREADGELTLIYGGKR